MFMLDVARYALHRQPTQEFFMSHSQPSNTQYSPASDMQKNRKNDDQKQPEV